MDTKSIIDFINSRDINAKQRIEEDKLKYLIYNGRLREVIKDQILREFKDPKTIQELSNRIVPINILRKSIDKLAKVYKNDPIRKPADLLPSDQDLISMYEKAFNINRYMQYANKLFKLNKHVIVEPYLDNAGIPRIRTVPSHSFWLFSDDKINPEKMTKYVKLIRDSDDEYDRRYAVWTNEEHWIIDGKGDIVVSEMAEMGNDDGLNRYGVIPAIHIKETIDLLYPVRPTDMLSVQFAICLLLSDTALAQKYLSWGTLTVVGGNGEESLHVGPAATIQIPMGPNGERPELKYLQPELNSDEVLRLVDKLVEYLLSTNNLSAGTVIGKMDTNSSASGISKMLDEVQSTEDKEEQKKYFEDAERDLWDLFAHKMLPEWVKTGEINNEYKGAFSQQFELDIYFRDMKPMLTEKEQVELIITKLNSGFLTTKEAMKEMNPALSDEQIDQKLDEIKEEKQERANFVGEMFGNNSKDDNDQADNND